MRRPFPLLAAANVRFYELAGLLPAARTTSNYRERRGVLARLVCQPAG